MLLRSRAHKIDRIFNPSSIAIVGASDNQNKVGGRIIGSLLFNEFRGKIYPVNPTRDSIQGLKAFPSLAAIGDAPDLVVFCVPSTAVTDGVTEACRVGAGALLVLASGFAELDEAGAAHQREIGDIARDHGVPLVGPNGLGVMNGGNGMLASSTVIMQGRRLKPGALSVVSQSGALGTYWSDLVMEAGLGVGKWISTGNEEDVKSAELIDYLADDEDTSVICVYLEGLRDSFALKEALFKAMQREKPVLVLRSGRSSAGAQATASHTGALATDDALFSALLAQYGAREVSSLTEMVDLARLLTTQKVRPGRRVCVVSNSGGAGALMTDAVSNAGYSMPPLAEPVVEGLKAFFPAYATPRNPVDLTDRIVTDTHLFAESVKAAAASGDYDIIAAFMGGRSERIVADIGAAAAELLPTLDMGHVMVWQSGTEAVTAKLTEAGVAIYSDIPEAVHALASATDMALQWSQPPLPPVPGRTGPVESRTLDERSGKEFLAEAAGIRFPRGRVAANRDMLEADMEEVGFPMVVKLVSPDVLHKSELGAVRLGVTRPDDVRGMFDEMEALCAEHGFRFEGLLLEEQVSVTAEMIVGLMNDPVFGPFLMVGRGGVMAELDADLSRAFLPVDAPRIETMLRSLKMSPLFDGFRGKASADLPAIGESLARLCETMQNREDLAEIEINPLALDAEGEIVALDAVIRVKRD